MKGVLPGTGILYGPRQVTFQIQDKAFLFAVYEAEIKEDCILGLNFLQEYHCVIDPVNKQMQILSTPSKLTVQLTPTDNSPSEIFYTRSLYFPVRTSTAVELRPHEARVLRLHLHADCELETGSSDAVSHWSSPVDFPSPESTTSCKEAEEPGINPSCNGLSSTCDGVATVILGGSSKVVCSMSPAPLSPGVCPVGQSVSVCPVGQPAPIG